VIPLWLNDLAGAIYALVLGLAPFIVLTLLSP